METALWFAEMEARLKGYGDNVSTPADHRFESRNLFCLSINLTDNLTEKANFKNSVF